MADHGDGHIRHARCGLGGLGWHGCGPRTALAAQLPFQQIAQTAWGGAVWVKKARAIEMVADRAGVVGFLCHAA